MQCFKAELAEHAEKFGGGPRFDTPQMLPVSPRCLPHGDRSFEVPLLPFGPEGLDVFPKIEQPAASGDRPESDWYCAILRLLDQAFKRQPRRR